MGPVQPHTPNQGHCPWTQQLYKNYARGGFFAAKESPSRAHPKKAILDDTIRPPIKSNSSEAMKKANPATNFPLSFEGTLAYSIVQMTFIQLFQKATEIPISTGRAACCRPADAKHTGKPGSLTLDPIAEHAVLF